MERKRWDARRPHDQPSTTSTSASGLWATSSHVLRFHRHPRPTSVSKSQTRPCRVLHSRTAPCSIRATTSGHPALPETIADPRRQRKCRDRARRLVRWDFTPETDADRDEGKFAAKVGSTVGLPTQGDHHEGPGLATGRLRRFGKSTAPRWTGGKAAVRRVDPGVLRI